ncbi:TIM-barrel domain-containing protein [Actinotalea sp.]|uniref:glycoside hydrolase family 31 protein n=1 Tax=Actinotalea sp. TaxID=1872145 RepID=UPI0035697259
MTFPRLGSRPSADPAAVVRGDHYRITVLTEGLVRLEWSPDGEFEDRASTFALNRELPVPSFQVLDAGDHLEIVTDRFRLDYDKGPFTTSGLSLSALGGLSDYQSVWRFGRPVADLGGTARTLDEADGPVPLEPGVVSRTGVAVLDDSESFLFEDDGWVGTRSEGRRDLYVFAYGRDYHGALRAFYALSGPTPLLPRFALGNWWSRYHRYTAESYTALIERFRAEGVPFSVSVIDMDWHVVDVAPEHGSGWTGYTWNRELFPDPEAFLAWLHENGLRVTLNVHPADGVRSYEEPYAAMAAALGRDASTGEPISFDVTDREFLTAYFEVLHRGLEEDGVDFWWLDWQSGPYSRIAGIDPLWMLNHFHYLDSARDGRRGLTFSRYAGPGSHRYPVGFSGDAVITWASLAFQPSFTSTAANIGYGWWSHDIGGHFHGTKDDELSTRWVQLGVFSPLMRLHSGANPFITKEPWSFSPEAGRIMTDFLRLRHRLLPYLGTMNHRAATGGTPLVLPMYYDWPEADEAYGVPHQFLFGSELVVAPITRPMDRSTLLGRVQAWLPAGTWVDLFTGTVYDGDRRLHLHRDLTTIPVLARSGAIVPLDAREVPPNGTAQPEHLEVLVVVGADGAFDLVEDDDGVEPAVTTTALRFDQAAGRVAVGPAQGTGAGVPAVRRWTLSFLAVGETETPVVRVDGVPVGATVERTATALRVTVEGVRLDALLEVEIGSEPQLRADDVDAAVFAVLDRAQIEHEVKVAALAAATGERTLAQRLSGLDGLGLDQAVVRAVGEVLLARAD